MNGTGPRNALTDVAGLSVGQAEADGVPTGVTVIVPAEPCVAAADQRGGAPGTRELALLEPGCLVERIDAVVLAGGSAYGLAAADGVVDALAADGRGFPVGEARVPIVSGLILFDLGVGPPARTTSLYAELGRRAYAVRSADLTLGRVGAGRGATCGSLAGGIGSASAIEPMTGATVAALAAVNAFGEVVIPGTSCFWAWPFERDGEFGGREPPRGPVDAAPISPPPIVGANTTLVVAATDAALDRPQAKRLAMMAQDGLARALNPVHTPFDGDTVIALATGHRSTVDAADLCRLGALGADTVARAIARGVFEAQRSTPATPGPSTSGGL
ncbi:MAG: P1 family peptidase [Pseudomonadota bacterium]